MANQLFLVSSPFTEPGKPLNENNKFVERLLKCEHHSALMVTSAPSDIRFSESFSYAIQHTLALSRITFENYIILDDRNKMDAQELVAASDFIILGGGHVPTQNAFFAEIGLKDCMKNFDGTVLGISAGSMNAASIVYAQPEEEGEAADPNYRRFLKGLGLTNVMLLPHYQDTKDRILDGKKLFEEVTYPDSFDRQFIAICDGSYLYADGTAERICGEAYLIQNGTISKICDEGKEYPL
ncbi:Type 1 glutamine amidotransferase-like domain-containing protein [Ruminococcus flavefaciens]|uniref:Type 1 glutamine amidotransferase-like domain-containing protein n=1 Tax=Ruminococcus flavefaciens TaxID=1265 RepID=UPI0013D91EDF|nr:Type 1 glutamine amidotransferase-like domain-containing protein [Ruminococcus flavefaciens]